MSLSSEMQNNDGNWKWFVDKVLPGLFISLCIGVSAVLWANYQSVQALTSQVSIHERDINTIKAEVAQLKAGGVTRSELLETLKRVEQQLEIMMLRARINQKLKITEGQ